jgi:hypothetical protein
MIIWPPPGVVGRWARLLLALASTVSLGFGSRRDPWPYFCSFQSFCEISNGASSSRRGEIWPLLVTPPLLEYFERALTHSLFRSIVSVAAGPRQYSLYCLQVSSRSMNKVSVLSSTCTCFDIGRPLRFWEKSVFLSSATFVGTSAFAFSWWVSCCFLGSESHGTHDRILLPDGSGSLRNNRSSNDYPVDR